MTASYEYSDVNADVESGSTFKWYVSEDAAGTNKVAITDAITQSYTLTTEDIGKYISFEVTPNDGTEFGESVESELQGPIEMIFVNTAPTVSNVSITGTLKEGELLTASYEYSDVNADVESGSTFKWYVSEDAVGTNKVAITDAITQSYTLTTEDIGKYISFEVTPNDGTEFGESVESELQGPIEVKEPIVNIPDANLKTALVADVLINTNGDSEIQVLEAEVFTGTVVASELEISDLTGIEAFINITGLDVRKNNNIASVDLSKNTKLTWLSIDQNKLTALDVSTLTSLDALYAGDNKIKSIDVSNNILLKKLWLNINELTAIDISKNTILEVLELDWNFGLTSIDFTTNLSLSKIHLWKTAISTLDVSFLLELEKLYVSETNLTTIDLTNNTKLIDFRASDSKISSFDFSENTELERIDVKGCNLTDLDISKNTKLKILLANENSLTGINTTKNTELNEMVVNNNAIINVDINNNYSLTKLLLNDNKLERTYLINGNNAAITEFDITNNPDLTCISVDNVDWSTTNWINKDAVASYNTDCSAEWEVYTEDEEFNDAIASVSGVDSDGDGVVTYEEAQAFTGDLDLSGLNISDITGLEAFTNAASINISGNVITDISNLLNANTVIVSSRTTGEKRTVKRKATSLQKLNVANNLINEIDLSEVSSLTELNVSNNKLMYLNLNNNSNTILIKVDATGNLELTCIQVDSVEDASNNADWIKDDIASYNTFCPKSVLTTENYLKESISMYPNPATTNIQITITSDIALRTVEIYNSIGKKVLESNKSLVDVKSLANGIYFVRVITNKGFINRKLIKK